LTKKRKVTFAEGCFDELAQEMTQDELDALVAEIEKMAENGELFDNAVELSDEESNLILSQLMNVEKNTRQ
jgi:hypothetical protein